MIFNPYICSVLKKYKAFHLAMLFETYLLLSTVYQSIRFKDMSVNVIIKWNTKGKIFTRCPKGTYGKVCENSPDICRNLRPCLNSAICAAGVNEMSKCTCPNGGKIFLLLLSLYYQINVKKYWMNFTVDYIIWLLIKENYQRYNCQTRTILLTLNLIPKKWS